MDVIYKRCCGIDVHKNMIMACVIVNRKKEIRKFGTMTDDILEMVRWLKEVECEIVALESTGVYWKPIHNILEQESLPIIVVNAQHIKAVPGQKTDVKDAEWIADLLKHGLVKASYIPHREQRELREITRYRQEIVNERARELNRIQAVLEGANIKLASVITNIDGKTGLSILTAIIDGQTDPIQLSALGCKNLAAKKIPELQRALKSSIGEHQMHMLKYQIEHITFMSKLIAELDLEIKKRTAPSEEYIELLDELPGIARRSAEKILAETGIEMNQFRDAAHFASWAGLVPQCNESAGKKKVRDCGRAINISKRHL